MLWMTCIASKKMAVCLAENISTGNRSYMFKNKEKIKISINSNTI